MTMSRWRDDVGNNCREWNSSSWTASATATVSIQVEHTCCGGPSSHRLRGFDVDTRGVEYACVEKPLQQRVLGASSCTHT